MLTPPVSTRYDASTWQPALKRVNVPSGPLNSKRRAQDGIPPDPAGNGSLPLSPSPSRTNQRISKPQIFSAILASPDSPLAYFKTFQTTVRLLPPPLPPPLSRGLAPEAPDRTTSLRRQSAARPRPARSTRPRRVVKR